MQHRLAGVVILVTLAGCSPDPETERLQRTVRAEYDTETGDLSQINYDSNDDGNVDTWTYMDGARIIRVEFDQDEDGLDTGAIVGVTVQDASAGDTTTLVDTLVTAAEQVEAVGAPGIAEVVADKGYHSNETMVGFAAIGVRSDVSEPDRGRRHWKGQAAARDAVYANRRRIRGARGKRLLRQRGELLERPNAHLYETGRMRRVHLRGHPNILKRLLVQVCGVNLGLLMRHLTGVGTPRSLQGRASALVEALIGLLSGCWGRVRRVWAPERHDRPDSSWDGPATRQYGHAILD